MTVRRILGVDPGWAHVGLAVADVYDGHVMPDSLVLGEVVSTKPRKRQGITAAQDDRRRARELVDALRGAALDQDVVGVDLIVCEAPTFIPTSSKASMGLGRFFGILDGLSFSWCVPVVYVAPSDIKLAAAGHRAASKQAVASGASNAFEGLEACLETYGKHAEHAYDAAGAILAALANEHLQVLFSERAS